MSHILLVDADKDLAFFVKEWLVKDNYTVDVCYNGLDASEYLRQGNYDVALLDWELPGASGLEVCQKYRASGGQTAILLLTAKTQLTNKEVGLNAGSDDYLCKPFAMRELSARVRALLRRGCNPIKNRLTAGPIEMDTDGHRVYKEGRQIHLNPKEFSVLEFLMRRQGEMISSEAIIQRVWGLDADTANDSVRTVVSRIRQKLDDLDDQSTSIVESMRKVGYRIRVN